MSTSPTCRFGESLDAGRINPSGFLFLEWVAFFTGIRSWTPCRLARGCSWTWCA